MTDEGTTSLEELIEAADAIAGGGSDQRLPVRGSGPLARLAAAVNRVTERLVRHEELLGENIRSLQDVNRELRETQETLLRSEKLATIGRLAAGVAHEIGNPLGAVIGYLDILRRRTDLDDDTKNWLARMDTEARRIDVIIRELLDFARPSGTTTVPVDIGEILSGAMDLVSHQKMFRSIVFDRSIASDLPPVMANKHKLQQVFVNLFVNACDAMPDGGTIHVSTELATKPLETKPEEHLPPRRRNDPPQVDYTHLRPRLVHDATVDQPFETTRRWIRTRITDEGRGIPPEQLREIFDPFFTTKPPGKGTGLGLAITLSAIRSLHGRLQVSSRVNVGTTFTIELPAAEADDEARWPRHGVESE